MKIYNYPSKIEWTEICRRPIMSRENLTATVQEIMDKVNLYGDKALFKYAKQFEQAELNELPVSEKEFEEAASMVSESLKEAIGIAKKNIERFHNMQLEQIKYVEPVKGVLCWRKSVGIEKVGTLKEPLLDCLLFQLQMRLPLSELLNSRARSESAFSIDHS